MRSPQRITTDRRYRRKNVRLFSRSGQGSTPTKKAPDAGRRTQARRPASYSPRSPRTQAKIHRRFTGNLPAHLVARPTVRASAEIPISTYHPSHARHLASLRTQRQAHARRPVRFREMSTFVDTRQRRRPPSSSCSSREARNKRGPFPCYPKNHMPRSCVFRSIMT